MKVPRWLRPCRGKPVAGQGVQEDPDLLGDSPTRDIYAYDFRRRCQGRVFCYRSARPTVSCYALLPCCHRLGIDSVPEVLQRSHCLLRG